MARVIKRVAAKRDLTDHFVFLGDNASVDVARRFLHACNVSFQALAHMPELGTQRRFGNPRFSSVRAWPVKGFERYLIFYRPQPFTGQARTEEKRGFLKLLCVPSSGMCAKA